MDSKTVKREKVMLSKHLWAKQLLRKTSHAQPKTRVPQPNRTQQLLSLCASRHQHCCRWADVTRRRLTGKLQIRVLFAVGEHSQLSDFGIMLHCRHLLDSQSQRKKTEDSCIHCNSFDVHFTLLNKGHPSYSKVQRGLSLHDRGQNS